MKRIKRKFSLKAWVRPPGWTLGGEAEAKIQLFHNMVMVATILPLDPLHAPWRQGQNVNNQLYQNMVMVHIKLKGMTNAATYKHIFCPYTYPRPLGWAQMSIVFFLKVVMLHIKLSNQI